jgi:predicted CoA-substrate-specific enzyme activase
VFSINQRYVGINIGSVSVNFVNIDDEDNINIIKRPHLGKPSEVLDEILAENKSLKECFYNVSGSFGDVSEVVAVERGVHSFDEKFDVIISLGGEAFVLYVLDEEGHIVNVLSHDKCAAGSGEFFIQQIDRLNISLSEAISLAKKGNKIEIASRCSVHCKSDITHKLNRGETSVEDVLTSVLASMANKIKGLIFQSRVDVKRVLLIGGVALNDAFVSILREDLEDVEVVVKDVSSVFEAYGSALLEKDSPKQKELKLKISKSFSTLPSLEQFSEQVTIIPSVEHKKDFNPNTSFILGVDVGSTTTKAILLDPEDMAIVASHYGRTSGNPVEATRKCIQEVISQVGNQKIKLLGVTGSGRQLVGAYLGTSAVYNEISAHSEGAVYYDEDVDTIFEIGGQDSKYMFLQNGVPVDYAMNASCSAGTGSFLEESAKGDLGVTVYDISDIAMKASNPVRFQADCAAFINTDVRTAMQENYGRDNIIGGLVFSIAINYLNKVKGTRAVGKKIFFQGGVAKNNAVGYAFAQSTGKEIIIPPNPELIGAFGIALIANKKYIDHEIEGMSDKTDLQSLISEELKQLSSFTCKACKNYCQIERYEVGGRKFPFGGSCSKYEHQWRGSDKTEEKENLVDLRNDLIFENNLKKKKIIKTSKGKIGITRALLTHTLYPLFSTFFEEMGFEVVLSDIDDDKEVLTNAPFCYPIQVLHGAVNDLVKRDIPRIFLPQVYSLEKGEEWFDATFCPITQSSPYFIATAFRETNFLSPLLNFGEGYEKDEALVKMATKELKIPKKIAVVAYKKAVEKQTAVEKQFLDWGRETIKRLKENNETGILLLGRSYNAFPPETSQLIPKKLASMGVTVIPFDFLEKEKVNDIPWYFSNYVKIAIDLAKENDNLFLLYINSYSCTIDAFVQNFVRTEMRSKPFLILELDSHTADAGTQTRLEAFLEIITNSQKSKKREEEKPFQVAKVKKRDGKIIVITSDNKRVDIKDPRIKLYFPSFSDFHVTAIAKLMNLYGFHAADPEPLKLDYAIRGLRHTTGKECVPLPIVIGHMLETVEKRKPGELIGFYMIRGGAPCAVYSYFHYLEQFIEQNKLENVFIFRFDQLTGFMGTPFMQIARFGPKVTLLGDLVAEVDSALEVVGENGGQELLLKYWNQFLDETTILRDFNKNYRRLIRNIETIPRKDSPKDHPKVLVSGDFFVRFSPFFLKELKEIYSQHGIIVKSTDLFELLLYGNYHLADTTSRRMNADQFKFTTYVKAFATIWKHNSRLFIISKFGPFLLHILERIHRRKFSKTGLLYAGPNDLREIYKQAEPWISPSIFCEAIPTIGKGLETLENSIFDSLVLTGPLNCLPYKISQAILKPIYLENHMPFLVFDSDITAISPNTRRLINANIEQIKRRRT